MGQPDLTVVCVKWGSKYGADYVNNLHDMVRRNLSTPHDFVCYTDDWIGIGADITIRPLIGGLEGWYNKLWLFSPESGLTGRVLYFDLDTVITGRLEEIAAYSGHLAMLKDFYGWTEYGSGVMAWDASRSIIVDLWGLYEREGAPIHEKGDQGWMCDKFLERGVIPDTFQSLYPGSFCSYKESARKWVPNGAKVVCFHGNLNPHEYPSEWIKDVWRIGGLSEVKLESKCNIDKQEAVGNIVSNMRLGLKNLKRVRDHDRTMVIVGGAPSVKHAMPEIRKARRGGDIWSVNGTHDWLVARGVIPDFFAMLDARKENREFVRRSNRKTEYLIASHCSNYVFLDLLSRESKVTVWHAYEPDLKGAIERYATTDEPLTLLGGGNTVVLKLLYMGRYLGYRKFKLFGVDSSYDEDEHHAYPQELNDGEHTLTVRVRDREFKCAPWMMVQANDFQEQVRALLDEDCEVTVNGRGLIPYIAQILGGSDG